MNKFPEIIILAGIIISLFMFLLLLSKKGKELSDRILSAWMLIISVNFLDFYLSYFTNTYILHPHLSGIFFPLALIHPPILYLYVQAIICPAQKNPWYKFLHVLPTLVFYICLVPFYLQTKEEKLFLITRILENDTPLLYNIFQYLLYAIGPVYIAASLISLAKHKKNIKNTFSYTEEINLTWINLLIYGICIVWVLILILDGFDEYFERPFDSNLYTSISGTILVILMGYYGMKQTSIFSNIKQNETQPVLLPETGNTDKKPNKKQGLKPENADKLIKQLTLLMEGEKMYLQPKISLYQLAAKMNISTNHLSQLLNDELNQNFFEFINQYRIEEVKRKLSRPGNKNFTILSIAYECGFNSKSSFNSLFRKHTGLTPKEYLKGLRS